MPERPDWWKAYREQQREAAKDNKLEADMDEQQIEKKFAQVAHQALRQKKRERMTNCPYHTAKAAGDESWDFCTVKLHDFPITEDDCFRCETNEEELDGTRD